MLAFIIAIVMFAFIVLSLIAYAVLRSGSSNTGVGYLLMVAIPGAVAVVAALGVLLAIVVVITHVRHGCV